MNFWKKSFGENKEGSCQLCESSITFPDFYIKNNQIVCPTCQNIKDDSQVTLRYLNALESYLNFKFKTAVKNKIQLDIDEFEGFRLTYEKFTYNYISKIPEVDRVFKRNIKNFAYIRNELEFFLKFI